MKSYIYGHDFVYLLKEVSMYSIIRALSLVLCLLLASCMPRIFGTSEVQTPENPAPVSLSPVPAFISVNSAGAQASIEDESFGGLVDVSVEGEFHSAAGRDCKRAVVSKPPHESEIVILCRQGDGWEMMPRVWGRGIQ